MCIFAIDMELKSDAIETLIKSVLTDISQKGYSSVQPFSIGKYKKLATRDQLYASEGNQAARSNCSSSLHCCSHATANLFAKILQLYKLICIFANAL